jgi:hypothetical protein
MPVNISAKDLSIVAAVSGVTTLSVRFVLFPDVSETIFSLLGLFARCSHGRPTYDWERPEFSTGESNGPSASPMNLTSLQADLQWPVNVYACVTLLMQMRSSRSIQLIVSYLSGYHMDAYCCFSVGWPT